MKRVYCIIVTLIWAIAAFAQNPEEIVNRMTEVWEEHEKEGIVMTMDTKIPIVGTVTATEYALGNKSRTEAKILGSQIITWDDGVTEWEYSSKGNKVTIKSIATDSSASVESDDDDSMFGDIVKGYDFSLKKETADDWTIELKKNKSNKDKDAPKTMEFQIAKKTYYLITFKTKMSGISVTMRDISFGVKEETVTFNIKDYPGATVVDERNKSK